MTDDEKNLKLFELAMKEEQYFLQEHQTRINFYSSLISTLIAATFAGLLSAKENYHYLALTLGPILIFAISLFAIKGTYRLYQRFLEAITIKAKIEQKLGLATISNIKKDESGWWATEAIIPTRFIETREKYFSSKDFVEDLINEGYHKQTKRLFVLFMGISVLMFFGLIYLGVSTIQKENPFDRNVIIEKHSCIDE